MSDKKLKILHRVNDLTKPPYKNKCQNYTINASEKQKEIL